jgi:hypothetical protein
MGIKDNALAQFHERLSGELFSIDVPEWSTKDEQVKVYYKGAMTGKQQAQIFKHYSEGKQVEAVFMSLIMRALDADGVAIWRANELTEMMRDYDPDVVGRIVEEISATELTVEQVKKS